MGVDLGILEFIQTYLQCDLLDSVMPFITKLGDGGILWICSALLLLGFPKTRKTGAAMMVSLGLEVICCNLLLKPFVARPRPCDVNPAMELLIPRPEGFSFPSGHTGASFAAASALLFGRNRLGIPAFVLASLIGFSRLYLYVHYPTDVFAGALLGIMLGWLGNILVISIGEKVHGGMRCFYEKGTKRKNCGTKKEKERDTGRAG